MADPFDEIKAKQRGFVNEINNRLSEIVEYVRQLHAQRGSLTTVDDDTFKELCRTLNDIIQNFKAYSNNWEPDIRSAIQNLDAATSDASQSKLRADAAENAALVSKQKIDEALSAFVNATSSSATQVTQLTNEKTTLEQKLETAEKKLQEYDNVKKGEFAALQKELNDLKANGPLRDRDSFQRGIDSVRDQYDLKAKSLQDSHDAKIQAVQDNTFSKFEELEAKSREKATTFFDEVGKNLVDKLEDHLANLVPKVKKLIATKIDDVADELISHRQDLAATVDGLQKVQNGLNAELKRLDLLIEAAQTKLDDANSGHQTALKDSVMDSQISSERLEKLLYDLSLAVPIAAHDIAQDKSEREEIRKIGKKLCKDVKKVRTDLSQTIAQADIPQMIDEIVARPEIKDVNPALRQLPNRILTDQGFQDLAKTSALQEVSNSLAQKLGSKLDANDFNSGIQTLLTTTHFDQSLQPLATQTQIVQATQNLPTSTELGTRLQLLATPADITKAVSGLATSQEVGDAVAPLATSQQVTTAVLPLATSASIARVAKSDDITFALQAYPNKTDLTTALVSVAKTTDLKPIATQNQVDKAVLTLAKSDQIKELASSISRLPEITKAVSAILEVVPNFAKKDDVKDLVKLDQLTSHLAPLATSASVDEIPTRRDMNTFVDSLVKTSDLQTSVASLATLDSLKNFATKQDLSSAVSKVTKPSDLDTIASNLASKSDIAGLSKNLDFTSAIGRLAKEDTLQMLSKKVDDVAKTTDLATITSSMAQQKSLEKVVTTEDFMNIANTLTKPSDIDTALQSVTTPLKDVAKSSELEGLATTKDLTNFVTPLAKEASRLTIDDVKSALADLPRSSDIRALATNQQVTGATASLAKVTDVQSLLSRDQLNAVVAQLPTKVDMANLVASEVGNRITELAKASDLAELARQADIESLRKLLETSRIVGNFNFPSVSGTQSQVGSHDDVPLPILGTQPFSSRLVQQTMQSDDSDLAGIGEHVTSTPGGPHVGRNDPSVVPQLGGTYASTGSQPSGTSAQVIPESSRARKHTLMSDPSISGRPPAKKVAQEPLSLVISSPEDSSINLPAPDKGKGQEKATDQAAPHVGDDVISGSDIEQADEEDDASSDLDIQQAGESWAEIQKFEYGLQSIDLATVSAGNYGDRLAILTSCDDALKVIDDMLLACWNDNLVQHLAKAEESINEAHKNVPDRLRATKTTLEQHHTTLTRSIRGWENTTIRSCVQARDLLVQKFSDPANVRTASGSAILQENTLFQKLLRDYKEKRKSLRERVPDLSLEAQDRAYLTEDQKSSIYEYGNNLQALYDRIPSSRRPTAASIASGRSYPEPPAASGSQQLRPRASNASLSQRSTTEDSAAHRPLVRSQSMLIGERAAATPATLSQTVVPRASQPDLRLTVTPVAQASRRELRSQARTGSITSSPSKKLTKLEKWRSELGDGDDRRMLNISNAPQDQVGALNDRMAQLTATLGRKRKSTQEIAAILDRLAIGHLKQNYTDKNLCIAKKPPRVTLDKGENAGPYREDCSIHKGAVLNPENGWPCCYVEFSPGVQKAGRIESGDDGLTWLSDSEFDASRQVDSNGHRWVIHFRPPRPSQDITALPTLPSTSPSAGPATGPSTGPATGPSTGPATGSSAGPSADPATPSSTPTGSGFKARVSKISKFAAKKPRQ